MPERRTVGSGSGLWPTPTGQDNPQVAGQYPDHPKRGTTLGGAVRQWPTPKASAAGPDFAKTDRSATGISLQTAVKMFPAPNSRDWKDTPGMALTAVNEDGTFRNRADQLARRVYYEDRQPTPGGSLNPNWVEWLMGWPPFWTAMAPLPLVVWSAWLDEFRPESTD